MHGIDESEPLSNGTLSDTFLYVLSDVDKSPSSLHLKPQFFSIALHLRSLLLSIRLPSKERGFVQVLVIDT